MGLFNKEKIQELYKLKVNFLKNYDKNNDGNVDLFEEDSFMNLLNKHQKGIIEIDKKYVLDFIKINEYLIEKRGNLNELLKSINGYNLKHLKYFKKSNIVSKYKELGGSVNSRVGLISQLKQNQGTQKSDLEELIDLFMLSIENYNLILFHSLNMITFLINDDMINFYKLYQMLDKLDIFNSNLEKKNFEKFNEISTKLSNLEFGINQMINKISIKEIISLINQTKKISKKEIYNYCIKLKNEK